VKTITAVEINVKVEEMSAEMTVEAATEIKDLTTDAIDGKILLMKRICPNCNNNLSEREMYFCHHCGQKLPEELIVDNASFKAAKSNFQEKIAETLSGRFKFNFDLSRKLILLFGLVLMVGLGALVFLYSSNLTMGRLKNDQAEKNLASEQENSNPPIEYQNSLDFGLDQPNLAFDKEELTSYVPADADFYLLGSNITSFYKLFWGEVDHNGLVSFLSDYVKEPFVIFGRHFSSENPDANEAATVSGGGWQLAMVLFLSDDSLQQETLDTKDFGDFKVAKVGQAIVVTKYLPFIDQIKDVSQGLAKSVAQKPQYISDKKELAPDGQLVLMDFNGNPQELYDLAVSYLPSQKAGELLQESLVDKQLSNFVVRKK
jgi:hypothetical protein